MALGEVHADSAAVGVAVAEGLGFGSLPLRQGLLRAGVVCAVARVAQAPARLGRIPFSRLVGLGCRSPEPAMAPPVVRASLAVAS